jgi:hypothetical protein
MAETVDLTFLGKQTEQALAELRRLHRELADVRTLTLQGAEQGRRLERSILDLRDELALLLKIEIDGRLGNFELRMAQIIDEKVDALRADLPAMLAEAVRSLKGDAT